MSRPVLFEALGPVFVEAFGDNVWAEVTLGPGLTRTVTGIFREVRSDGFAELEGVDVEGVTHVLKVASVDAAGLAQDMEVAISATGAIFAIAGVHHDGRAMHTILLQEPE
jgi:hypothetical protein